MAEKIFDIAILGGGPGGYTAAIRAAQLGFSVGLIEEKFMGGTCLNIGCIPTKALIHCANLIEDARGSKTYGITIPEAGFDWDKILKYKERCVIKLRKGTEFLMTKNKIDVSNARGRLVSSDTIEAGGDTIKAKHIILAMGSYARSLPSLPIDGDKLITSDHALSLTPVPSKLLVVGAGAIGCEFAYVFSTFGTQVTIVEFLDHALPLEDQEVSVEFEAALKRQKIKLYTRHTVEKVEIKAGVAVGHIKPRDGGDEFTVEADRVLVAVGRGPSTSDCGLEALGIPIDRGFIKVDEHLKTGIGNIRAIGDAVGGYMLAHKASAEGIHAVEDIAGMHGLPIIYENVPRATYCKPEVASVGLSEEQAKAKFGDDVKVGKFPFAALGKAVIEGEPGGFAKLVSYDENRTLVGASIIGIHATDLIATAATAISTGLNAEEFAHVIQAHPTLSEIWHEASHGLLDGALNA
jgi:dihydrolipoamide dehydrogenase